MRNRHGGSCYKCGEWVSPGTGHFERHNGGWRVQHALVSGDGRMTCVQAATDIERHDDSGYPFTASNPLGERE